MTLSENKVISNKGKSYGQLCGVAKALDVVGERWTLLILRDLMPGPRRYSDLMLSLAGITTNLLAKRLSELSAAGLVEKFRIAGTNGSSGYRLTNSGRKIEPVVLSLANFGSDLAFENEQAYRGNPRWLMLNLQRRFRGSGRDMKINLDLSFNEAPCPFSLNIQQGEIALRDGLLENPDVILSGKFGRVTAWALGKETLATLLASGHLEIDNTALVDEIDGLFPVVNSGSI